MPISRPAVSRHLRLLKDAGLVAEHAEGTRRIYHLHEQGLQAVRSYLEGVWGDAATRFRLLAENTERGHRAVNAPLRVSFEVTCSARARVRDVDGGDQPVVAARPHRDRPGRRHRPRGRGRGSDLERTADGVEHDWGQVTVWEPPTNCRTSGTSGATRGDATEVEVRFIAHGPARHPDRDRTPGLGAARGPGRGMAGAGTGAGWGTLLPHFVAAVSKGDRLMAAGTEETHGSSPPLPAASEYTMYRDEEADPRPWSARWGPPPSDTTCGPSTTCIPG